MSYPKQRYVPISTPQQGKTVENNDEALLTAIRMCNIEKCQELVSSDPEVLHRKGWNQLTALHQACLSGQKHIVELFLRHGANPNARNSFEETPLHYACRRGVLSVAHLMMKNGADSSSVDKRGRSCMHFAALGGSVVMLHYLRAHTELNFDTPDDTGRNILHVACEMRHFPALCYLLKHNRVDPSLKDLRGVTPLHIAVEKGYSDLVWSLLLAGGCELLRIEDQKGETPCDIAKKGSHVEIYKTLSYYSSRGFKGHPTGPVFTWYFMMFLPFVYLAIVFLLAKYMNSYGGHFATLMFLLLAYLVAKQSHRINHICRWPNPMYVGTFIGGIFHCAIAQFGHLQPSLWPCPAIVTFVTVLTGVGLYLLGYLLFSDPGVDNCPKMCPSTGKPLSVLDIAEGRAHEMEFCSFSEMIHGEHTKYCKICEAPMLDIDHHCLFLNTCIARNNHKHFIALIVVVMILQFLFVLSSCLYMHTLADRPTAGLGDSVSPYLIFLYKNDPWVFCLTVLCVGAFLWEYCLIHAQFSVIMRGSTTYLTLKHKNPSKGGVTYAQKFKNLLRFFLGHSRDSISRSVSKDATPLI